MRKMVKEKNKYGRLKLHYYSQF